MEAVSVFPTFIFIYFVSLSSLEVWQFPNLLVLLSIITLTAYTVEPHLDFVSICPLIDSTMFSERVREGFLLLTSPCPLFFLL